jgi:hypothetical protein
MLKNIFERVLMSTHEKVTLLFNTSLSYSQLETYYEDDMLFSFENLLVSDLHLQTTYSIRKTRCFNQMVRWQQRVSDTERIRMNKTWINVLYLELHGRHREDVY